MRAPLYHRYQATGCLLLKFVIFVCVYECNINVLCSRFMQLVPE